jgi:hypothetical protein
LTRKRPEETPAGAHLLAIACPVERAARITEWGHATGRPLPRNLAAARRAALAEARYEQGRRVGWLVEKVPLSRAWIYRLTSTAPRKAA